MKTNVHLNSLDTYFSLIESGVLSKQQKLVVETLRENSGLSIEGISLKSGMPEKSVSPRTGELLEMGIIVRAGTTTNVSGNKADALALKEKFYQ